jgi:hypothetical protein
MYFDSVDMVDFMYCSSVWYTGLLQVNSWKVDIHEEL